MASLLQKLKTLFKANLHEMADKTIQQNDLAVYDQYIRAAEREVAGFKETIAPLFAQVKASRRRRDDLADKAAKYDLAIDHFLVQGKKTEAMVTQKQLNSALELIETYDASLVTAGRGC